jgi:hypothetical protein
VPSLAERLPGWDVLIQLARWSSAVGDLLYWGDLCPSDLILHPLQSVRAIGRGIADGAGTMLLFPFLRRGDHPPRRRHAATTIALRAIRTIGSGRRIPIRPNYHFAGQQACFEAPDRDTPRCSPPPHQDVKISHPEHGGNGESREVVNQWLPWRPVDLPTSRAEPSLLQGPLPHRLLRQITTRLRFSMRTANLFDCATGLVVLSGHGEKGHTMIETVTAFLGLVSAGIFLAHALDGLRSRA